MGRTEYTDDKFRDELLNDINQFSRSGKAQAEKWNAFAQHVYFQVSDVKHTQTYIDQAKRVADFTTVRRARTQRNLSSRRCSEILQYHRAESFRAWPDGKHR